MANVSFGGYSSAVVSPSVNMDALHIRDMFGAIIQNAVPTGLFLTAGDNTFHFTGTGFTYDANDQITGGTLTDLYITEKLSVSSGITINISGLNTPIAPFAAWIPADATQTAFSTLLANADRIVGTNTSNGDLIRGYGGSDQIAGNRGSDTIFGGLGDDTIFALASSGLGGNPTDNTYLRGDEGNDSITGGDGFDDINGNMGEDTVYGAGGADWVVGGQGNDLLFGEFGSDIVYGNMGADTCDGGIGSDTIRGGQDNDSISGGAGYDWISGDRGDDTMSGGADGDVFYFFAGSGVDRVLDFHLVENGGIGPGDRVMLDAGQAYTLSQVGADTVIDIGGGDKLILVGVQMSTLNDGWLLRG